MLHIVVKQLRDIRCLIGFQPTGFWTSGSISNVSVHPRGVAVLQYVCEYSS